MDMRRLLGFALLLAFAAGCAATAPRPASVARLDRFDEVGVASYVAGSFDGRATSSGSIYDSHRLTAAHRTLPFGTRVRVTNLANDRAVVVTITDRGPFRRGRIVDLSRRAAAELGFVAQGTARVRLEVVGGEPRVAADN